MLLGTTFAWFTDSATSAGNKIVAGTLDVQLWMYDESESDYVNIGDSAKPIFGKADSHVAQNDAQDTLWEPGKTQVVYLKIVNNGSLDLKYNVAINVRDTADDKNLYEVLEYAIDADAKATDAKLPVWDGGKKVIVGNNVDTTTLSFLQRKMARTLTSISSHSLFTCLKKQAMSIRAVTLSLTSRLPQLSLHPKRIASITPMMRMHTLPMPSLLTRKNSRQLSQRLPTVQSSVSRAT
jgi:predicted ribosomally synthesized peptide with SipW-like signal peptide